MHASASATSCGKSSRSRSDLRHVPCLGPAAEREQRERAGVPADRRLGGRRAPLERPAGELGERPRRRPRAATPSARRSGDPRRRDPRRRPSSRASARPPAAAIQPDRASPAISIREPARHRRYCRAGRARARRAHRAAPRSAHASRRRRESNPSGYVVLEAMQANFHGLTFVTDPGRVFSPRPRPSSSSTRRSSGSATSRLASPTSAPAPA